MAAPVRPKPAIRNAQLCDSGTPPNCCTWKPRLPTDRVCKGRPPIGIAGPSAAIIDQEDIADIIRIAQQCDAAHGDAALRDRTTL